MATAQPLRAGLHTFICHCLTLCVLHASCDSRIMHGILTIHILGTPGHLLSTWAFDPVKIAYYKASWYCSMVILGRWPCSTGWKCAVGVYERSSSGRLWGHWCAEAWPLLVVRCCISSPTWLSNWTECEWSRQVAGPCTGVLCMPFQHTPKWNNVYWSCCLSSGHEHCAQRPLCSAGAPPLLPQEAHTTDSPELAR